MANQINVGIQNQFREPFGAADSEAENPNADASLAGDSAGGDTSASGNPDIVQPYIQSESVNPALAETVANNNLLNRYGISHGIIIQRPEYTFNNRAAPVVIPTNFAPATAPAQVCPDQADLASSGLETNAPVGFKPTENPPTGATSDAKDAANNSAPAKSRGIAVPPHDSVPYIVALNYGAQHGYETWQIDQVAAVLAYYGCEKQQDCANLLADGGLPFHITSITQAMGDPRADGTFDVALVLRNIQEAQTAMSGDRDAGNRLHDLSDGRAAGLAGAHISSRASVGQGDQDYANEMSMSSGASDIASIDFSDESYNASNSYDVPDALDNTPQTNLNPLPSLPPVDSSGPIMLPPPDIRLDRELAPIPAIDTSVNQSAPNINETDADLSTAFSRAEDNPNFMGYNTDGQPLLSDPTTQRYAPSNIGVTGYHLTGLSSAVEGSMLGFDAAGTPYSGVLNAAGEMSWYALGFAEANSIMNARANGAFAEVGALGLARGAIPSAGMAAFTMLMPGNAGRDSITTDLADGSRFVRGAGELNGRLEVRDADGNWVAVPGRATLGSNNGIPFAMLSDDERRNTLPPSLIPPPNPGNGMLTNPALTEDERNRLNGTTISPIQPGSLPPLEGFQIAPPRTIDDLIIESSRAPNGSARANGYDYEFDGNSRIDNVEGDLNREDGTRSRTHQSGAGGADRLPDDDGGHIVGNRFNPPGEEFNYIAQNSNFNRGSYRQLENDWARLLDDGHTVHVRWDFEYSGDSQRPDGFTVRYRVDDGQEIEFPFRNRREGK